MIRTIAPPHPGRTILHECIEPSGLTMADAAAHLGVARSYLSDVVAGLDRINADLAVRLALAWGLCARSWLDMQSDFDLAQIDDDDSSIEVGRLRPLNGHWVAIGPHDPPQDWRRAYSEPGVPRDEGQGANRVTYWSVVTGDEGAWRASIPDLPGCAAEAPTVASALRLVAHVAEEWLRLEHEAGRPSPLPSDIDELLKLPDLYLSLALDDCAELRKVRVALRDLNDWW